VPNRDRERAKVRKVMRKFAPMTRHHNREAKNPVDNGDGSYSSVSTMIVGDDRGERVIPTIRDGQRLEGKEAAARARKEDWPTYKTVRAADRDDKTWHRTLGLTKKGPGSLNPNHRKKGR